MRILRFDVEENGGEDVDVRSPYADFKSALTAATEIVEDDSKLRTEVWFSNSGHEWLLWDSRRGLSTPS